MSLRPSRPLILAVLVASAGCASVPRDAGVSQVRRDVQEAIGARLDWAPDSRIEPPGSDDDVAELLQGELTADRAVQIALRRNRDLLATLEELGLARADLIAASTVRNPVVDAELRFPADPTSPFEIAVTKTLVDLIRLPARRRAGLASFEAARLRVTGAVIGFAAEVRADYYAHLGAARELVREEVVARSAEAAAGLARRQHAAGNISDLDLENQQALYERAKLELARAGLEAQQTRERLRNDLGLVDPATVVRLPEAFPPVPESDLADRAPEELERTALEKRFDVGAARSELEAARRAVPTARLGALDELAVGVHREREPEGTKTTGPSVTIPIPIFDRGEARKARAVATFRQALQRLNALELTARAEVRTACQRLLEARARAAYLRDVVIPRRQRILSLAQLEHNAMLRGVFQLLAAREEEARAQRELLEGQRDYWTARAQLDVALLGVGGLRVRPEVTALSRARVSTATTERRRDHEQ